MEKIERSAIVPYSAEAIYSLVSDIERYPDFLPWCKSATIHSKTEEWVEASLELSKGAISKSFTTKNHLIANREMEMHLVNGPFKHLYGIWKFEPLSESACKVSVSLEFSFSSKILELAIGPVFNHMANSLLDAFCARAKQVCSNPSCSK
ncbi:MAG: cyclase/dehydrase [Gammaproteobacteria bacterium]|jgi:ribosome-associated toxin RatA of RatAB toxin-antitoxin module|nr:cyclase/dehydrase [Gammaproteobacteria bacterium]